MIYSVINSTRNIPIGRRILVANSSEERRTGLLKQNSLAEGSGLWINPCEAIHTFFMRFSIDVIFLDRQNRVRKVSAGLRPWRMSACLVAKSVLELPAGTAARTLTVAGDQLVFEKSESNFE
jgi:uncharacterized membrane protein (UPF0127 family)